MGFDNDITAMTAAVMEDLGTPAKLRHADGREVDVMAVIERDQVASGEYGQLVESQTVASLDLDAAGEVALGTELMVSTAPYRGTYTLERLREGDGFVERFAMRIGGCA